MALFVCPFNHARFRHSFPPSSSVTAFAATSFLLSYSSSLIGQGRPSRALIGPGWLILNHPLHTTTVIAAERKREKRRRNFYLTSETCLSVFDFWLCRALIVWTSGGLSVRLKLFLYIFLILNLDLTMFIIKAVLHINRLLQLLLWVMLRNCKNILI